MPFLNSPPPGRADKPAHHEPRSLIQGEPVTHPLKYTRINCELRRSLPDREQQSMCPLALPASLTPPTLGTHRHVSTKCLLLSPIPTYHQLSSPFLTQQKLIIYTEGGYILRILYPQGPREEARQERKALAVLTKVKDATQELVRRHRATTQGPAPTQPSSVQLCSLTLV